MEEDIIKIKQIVENSILEYFTNITNDKNGISKVANKYNVHVYNGDRVQFPPHVHICDKEGIIEFEVCVIDLSITNIKYSSNKKITRLVAEAYNNFLEWLHNKEDKSKLPYYMVMFNNIDNVLKLNKKQSNLYFEAIKFKGKICDELKDYIKVVYKEEIK